MLAPIAIVEERLHADGWHVPTPAWKRALWVDPGDDHDLIRNGPGFCRNQNYARTRGVIIIIFLVFTWSRVLCPRMCGHPLPIF